MPKVSVILPSLNVQPYIRACMESVVHQTLNEIEIICVDAGSTDGTLEILREYAAKDERVQLILSDRRSYGYQMNIGIQAAKSDYIGIVETDDVVDLNMFRDLIAIAQQHDLDFVKADFNIFYGDGDSRTYVYRAIVSDQRLYHKMLRPSAHLRIFDTFGYSWAGLIKRSFLKDNNIIHHESAGASFQDNGFFVQTYAYANRAYFVDHPYYYLRRDNPGSSVNSKKGMMIFDEFAFAAKQLKQNAEIDQSFRLIFPLLKLKSYLFGLQRVPETDKYEFVRRFHNEFQAHAQAGELKKRVFQSRWTRVKRIVASADDYYNRYVFNPELLFPKDESEQENYLKRLKSYVEFNRRVMKHSAEYKLGAAILWPYRTLAGGWACLREHGLGYTIRRTIEHLGIPMNAEQSRTPCPTRDEEDEHAE